MDPSSDFDWLVPACAVRLLADQRFCGGNEAQILALCHRTGAAERAEFLRTRLGGRRHGNWSCLGRFASHGGDALRIFMDCDSTNVFGVLGLPLEVHPDVDQLRHAVSYLGVCGFDDHLFRIVFAGRPFRLEKISATANSTRDGMIRNCFRDYEPGTGRHVRSDPIGFRRRASDPNGFSLSIVAWADVIAPAGCSSCSGKVRKCGAWLFVEGIFHVSYFWACVWFALFAGNPGVTVALVSAWIVTILAFAFITEIRCISRPSKTDVVPNHAQPTNHLPRR